MIHSGNNGTKNRRIVTRIFLIILIVALVATVKLTGLDKYLTFESMKEHRDFIEVSISNHPYGSALIFIIIYLVITALSLPGAAVMTLGGGFFFGTLKAVILTNIGATLGAVCAFFLTRFLVGSWFQNKYEAQLAKFNDEISIHGYNYLLTLRFIPLFPFFLINILAGLTRIPFRTFLWTTIVGILPGDFVYSLAGSQLSSISKPGDIISAKILGAFILLGLFSIAPVLYARFTRRKKVSQNNT